jgi:hypothetical protein
VEGVEVEVGKAVFRGCTSRFIHRVEGVEVEVGKAVFRVYWGAG